MGLVHHSAPMAWAALRTRVAAGRSAKGRISWRYQLGPSVQRRTWRRGMAAVTTPSPMASRDDPGDEAHGRASTHRDGRAMLARRLSSAHQVPGQLQAERRGAKSSGMGMGSTALKYAPPVWAGGERTDAEPGGGTRDR